MKINMKKFRYFLIILTPAVLLEFLLTETVLCSMYSQYSKSM
jgi:hypothetical protein